MINLKVEEGKVSGQICGKLLELCAETTILLKYIHKGIKDSSEEAAKEFEHCITCAVRDGVIFDEDKLKEMVEEKSDLKKVRNDLLDKIEKILNVLEDTLK